IRDTGRAPGSAGFPGLPGGDTGFQAVGPASSSWPGSSHQPGRAVSTTSQPVPSSLLIPSGLGGWSAVAFFTQVTTASRGFILVHSAAECAGSEAWCGALTRSTSPIEDARVFQPP